MEDFAFAEVTNGDFKVILCHVARVHIFLVETDQHVVAFQVVVGDIMRMDRHQSFEALVVDRNIKAKILSENLDGVSLLSPPVAERASIFLHDDVISLPIYSIVVEIGDTFL